MNRAEKFTEQNNTLWREIVDYINDLSNRIKNTDLSDAEILAYVILENFDAGYVDTFEVTRVDDQGVLYGVLDDEEDEIPFDMMTIESLIQLTEKLEKYVDDNE